MKLIILILFLFQISNIVYGQKEPQIVFKNGSVSGNSISNLDGKDFGFRILPGFGEIDTIKCKFIHSRDNLKYLEIQYQLSGPQNGFRKVDIRGLKAGDKLHFFIEANGENYLQTFDVTSTLSSARQPYSLKFYFLFNGDTLTSDKFKIYNGDSTALGRAGIQSVFLKEIKAVLGPNYREVIYSDPIKLPKNLYVDFAGKSFDFWFNHPNIYHGTVFLKFTNKKVRARDKTKPDFNTILEVWDADSGAVYTTKKNSFIPKQRAWPR